MALYFLINSLWAGGAERVAVRLAEKLNPSKIFLLEKSLIYKTKSDIFFLSKKKLTSNSIVKTLYIPLYAIKLNSFLKQDDTVISFMERANFVNIVSGSKHNKIISIRTALTARFFFHPYNFLAKKLYPKADKIITVSRRQEFDLISHLKIKEEKIKTIYNPIEVEEVKRKLKEALEEYEFFKSFPYLLNVGRLSKPKGQWYLLRIFRQIKKKYKDLKLVILGEGELKDYLVELSQNLGLKTYVWDRDQLNESYDVYFLGFQENPYKFIKYSKMFVFTSLWEGLPNVLIETLAVGKTILSTDCRTGPREILAPKTDFLLETNKPQPEEFGILMPTFERKLLKANDPLTRQEKMWIETLIELLDNDILLKEYELKAPSRARDFHIDKISQQWLDVIEQ